MAAATSAFKNNSMGPGFIFDPAEEDLVVYYLKRKILGKSLPPYTIMEVDIYDFEPWELSGQSQIVTEDRSCYFFYKLEKTCDKVDRCTNSGFWKIARKSHHLIKHKSRVVGVRRTLSFQTGRAPQAHRTDWIMYEYRLSKEELIKLGNIRNDYVICKVFRKPNAERPLNCDRAPVAEEHHDDDKVPDNNEGNCNNLQEEFKGLSLEGGENEPTILVNGSGLASR